jgi:glycosyltransferase involved in cell wall biosynthesis
MKILYSLAHPADTLASERAGHVVRASALLAALESLGHEVVRVEAALNSTSQVSVAVYRRVVKRLLPGRVARAVRDVGRLRHGRAHGRRLFRTFEDSRPDVILETYTPMNSGGAALSRRTGVPLVVDDLAPAWEDDVVYGVGIPRLAARVRRAMIGQARLVVAVNAALRDAFYEEGIPESKVVVVENGVSDRFPHAGDGAEQRLELGFAPTDVVIAYVGSFQPFHRVELLVDAFSGLPADTRGRLLLVGDGVTLPQVKARVTAAHLQERVTIVGQISYDRVASYVAAADAGVLPATEDYTNPMKVVEYLATARPVIAPRQRAVADLVVDGENGILFEPGDVGGLRDALRVFIDDDDVRRRLRERAARSSARDQTWQRAGEKLARALSGLQNA